MINFLRETEIAIRDAGRDVSEIVFIGSMGGYGCTWPEFVELADRNYDPCSSTRQVVHDLIIAFDDGAALLRERRDYDYERWEYHCAYPIPANAHTVRTLFCERGFVSLRGVNLTEEEV